MHPPGDDLKLPDDMFAARRRAALRGSVSDGTRQIDEAAAPHQLNAYHEQALELVTSGRAREPFDLAAEADAARDLDGRNTSGQS